MVTVDGVAVLYLNPDELPVTAFFVMPSRFAEFLMQADEKPESLSLNLIRNLCGNVDFIYRKERKDLFRKVSRGRRYVR